MTAKQVFAALREVARDDKAAFLPKFFQAFPGGLWRRRSISRLLAAPIGFRVRFCCNMVLS